MLACPMPGDEPSVRMYASAVAIQPCYSLNLGCVRVPLQRNRNILIVNQPSEYNTAVVPFVKLVHV